MKKTVLLALVAFGIVHSSVSSALPYDNNCIGLNTFVATTVYAIVSRIALISIGALALYGSHKLING